jgi:hypothetical protein
MSYTNKTTYYELPQYIGTDKPTYLGDFNGAMMAIDTAMHNNATAASGAQSTADTANSLANNASNQANSANSIAVEAKTASETNAASIEALQTTVASLTIDVGSNSNGGYIILPGNILICYKMVTTQSITIDTPWTNGFIHPHSIILGNFAKPFKNAPVVTVTSTSKTAGQGAMVVYNEGEAPNIGLGTATLYRPSASSTSTIYDLMVIAIGENATA